MRIAIALLAAVLVAPMAQADHVSLGEIGWACGFGSSGHPDRCGIDPVGGDVRVQSEGDPVFQPAGEVDWIPGDARVIGLDLDGVQKAYPVRMLNHHEIVNDVIGDTQVAVTFCPLCGSGVTFVRTVPVGAEAVETNFTASGYLWSTDMVMWDPVSNQLWNQITGQPIAVLENNRPAAEHRDLQLTVLPTTITTWDAWKQEHVDTLLLQPVRSTGSYREHIYSSTSPESCAHGLSGTNDCDVNGLHPKVQVVGHDDGAGGVAFPIHNVSLEGGAVFLETADGRGFVGAADVHGAATIYDAGDHTFTADPSGLWMDESGGLWDLREGQRVDAPGQLEPLPGSVMFWFAWHDHYPDTEIWLPAGAPALPAPDGRGIPAPGLIWAAVAILALVASTRKGL